MNELIEKAHSGIMVAMYLPAEIAAKLALDGGEPVGDLHVTLAYIPKLGEDAAAFNAIVAAVSGTSGAFASPEGWIGGHGVFNGSPTSDGMDVYWASFNCPALPALREDVVARIEQLTGHEISRTHGYTPHVTLKYMKLGDVAPTTPPKTSPFSVPMLSVVSSNFRADVPFSGMRLLKEAPALRDFLYTGPEKPSVMFVLCDERTPTLEEELRREPLVNEDRVAFEKRYLASLGVKRAHVGVAWCDAERGLDALMSEIEKRAPKAIVCLGDVRTHGGEREHVNLPRFARADDVWKSSYRDEVDRKLRALKRKLDAESSPVAPSIRPLLKAARLHDGNGIADAQRLKLFKALEPERIVYGVVLDPYQVDLQRDWCPPRDIQETAWGFLAKHGYISDRHDREAPDAQCVESSLEQYPSRDDYEKAMAGLPHRAYRRKFGSDVIHSGAWVMAVKLSPRLWADYERGELDAFSIEGFGSRVEAHPSEMPRVTFVDLEAVG